MINLKTTELDPQILLALSKLLAGDSHKKACRKAVNEGVFDIDHTIRISGTMKVSGDHQAVIYTAVPWAKVLGVALSKLNGVTLESVVREALSGDCDEDAIKESAQAAVDKVMGSTKKPRKGKVTYDFDVSEVHDTTAMEFGLYLGAQAV